MLRNGRVENVVREIMVPNVTIIQHLSRIDGGCCNGSGSGGGRVDGSRRVSVACINICRTTIGDPKVCAKIWRSLHMLCSKIIANVSKILSVVFVIVEVICNTTGGKWM